MGVAAIIEMIARYTRVSRDSGLSKELAIAVVVSIACLCVPIQMASQTWDDHDRSGRYTCRDFGQNYLMSLQQEGNPIIYTNGDNDTFPLWYNQDTEGVRTDARVCNLSYLQTDWYIDQMLRPAYDSPSVPISWSRLEYCAGTNEYVTVDPSAKQQVLQFYQENPQQAKEQFGEEPFELKNILKYWVRSKHPDLHIIPTDTLYLTIDKEAVRKSGMLMPSDSIPDRMVISLKGKNALYKGDLMMLEMIAQCNWVRPIYVALTVGRENYMNLGDNFIQEGLVNRITPFTTNIDGRPVEGMTNFDTKKTYDIVMKHFKFGGIDQKGIYLDETVMRMCYTHRRLLSNLALELIKEGDNKRATEVLDFAEKQIPSYNVPTDFQSGSLDMARAYAALGQKAKASNLLRQLMKKSSQYLAWYCSLDGMRFAGSQPECMLHLYVMQQVAEIAESVDSKLADQFAKQLDQQAAIYQAKGGNFGD